MVNTGGPSHRTPSKETLQNQTVFPSLHRSDTLKFIDNTMLQSTDAAVKTYGAANRPSTKQSLYHRKLLPMDSRLDNSIGSSQQFNLFP